MVMTLIDVINELIELHKPQEITLPNGEWGINCAECDRLDYPCNTIKIIKKC